MKKNQILFYTRNKRKWGNLKEMTYFILLMAFECEKPTIISELSAWKATNLMVITWLTGARVNSKSNTINYKMGLKP